MDFGLIVIGDEILSGYRQDKHLSQTIELLNRYGHHLKWCYLVGDEPEQIISTLRTARENASAVFCCGGIGATPDDYTRQCAAKAFELPLVTHAQALVEIEAQFGEKARPKRILMAELPEGASLIPNPVNRVPGFSVGHVHFLPGFPEMANPMREWILAQYVGREDVPSAKKVLRVIAGHESDFIDLMASLIEQGLKVASLPHLGKPEGYVEFVVSGNASTVEQAFSTLKDHAKSLGYRLEYP
ncbi:MAG: competence/damage-inducible protein A [Gammaproteobacteria bacterium]|nr:competence/damage-inducible protein A [Gammaproteobacteria bacterium]